MLQVLPRGLGAQIQMGMLLLALSPPASPVSGGVWRPEAQEGGGGGDGDTLSHAQSLSRRLEALLAGGNGSDVTLRVETLGAAGQVKLIQAHALVLSLQSAGFRRLLLARNGSTLVLTESAADAAVFEQFVRYLYCGEISLHLDQATPLHRLATKYQVLALREGVARYMTQNLSPGRTAAWYWYAVEAGDAALRDVCLRYLSWNLPAVLRSAEWRPEAGGRLLAALSARSDLVLTGETELLAAVEAWVERARPDGLAAENALRAVRYAMVPPRELFGLEARSAALARYRESVRDLFYMAYQFHSASPMHMAKYFDVNCSLFAPRNYLSAAWGAPWVIGQPARDDRSTSFQTQLGPSGHDAGKRVTWNALFSPRWRPLGGTDAAAGGGGGERPRLIVTPATSSAEFAGVSFQKTVLVMARRRGAGELEVRHVYDFYQSTEENADFLAEADLQRRTSDYLVDGSLHLHILVKPLYQTLITSKN